MSSHLWRIPHWFPLINPEAESSLRIFHTELIKWNPVINLSSQVSIQKCDRNLFADAYLAYGVVKKHLSDYSVTTHVSSQSSHVSIHDFGSGNGVPGLIWAVLDREIKFTLVDSDERKVGFLRNMAAKLRLSNVGVIHGRVESLVWDAPEPRLAVCRGFASIQRTLELSGNAFATVFHMKGPKADEEIEEAECVFGVTWTFETIGSYVLPETLLKHDEFEAQRVIVLTKLR